MIKIADGHVYPNTTFQARWRITDSDGTQELGPSVSLTYADTRFNWKTKTGPIVRVHWYNGDDAFGARALAIGEKGIANAAALFGVTETEPVDFFIYDSTAPFYDALGPGTRENVGGEANTQIRTLFALITPDEINASWVGTVIPHELTHLVFNTATENPFHSPPRWLNEGLAVYLSEGYTAAWRSTVAAAVGVRRDHPARRPDRPVPDHRRPVLAGLRRERGRRRLHDPDLWPARPGQARPLVRRRSERRRGVQGRPGRRHERF